MPPLFSKKSPLWRRRKTGVYCYFSLSICDNIEWEPMIADDFVRHTLMLKSCYPQNFFRGSFIKCHWILQINLKRDQYPPPWERCCWSTLNSLASVQMCSKKGFTKLAQRGGGISVIYVRNPGSFVKFSEMSKEPCRD